MKQKRVLSIKLLAALMIIAVMLTALRHELSAQQPYSSYWYPATILQWSPDNDPDAKYNKSGVPLEDRFIGDSVNSNATADPKIMNLSIMYPSTSNNPSQGADIFDSYAFGYWQYADCLVMWGGSAGEGIIVPPSADVIDAGHKNGVPVLGTVFFPPTAYGGQLQWVRDFLLQNTDGSFPVADKLIEVAGYYGFDGWFINQETAGCTDTDATNMQNFMKYFQANKPAGMQLVWYDSMIYSGDISWQNELNDKNSMFFQDGAERVSDSIFINFDWTDMTSSSEEAVSLNRSPYDVYAGIDVQAEGYETDVSWSGVFPTGQPAITSMGIYCPNWTFSSSGSVEEFYQKENRFWAGANADPRNTYTTDPWKGFANYIIDRSPINALPFTTHFNTGNGRFFAVDGQVLRTREWNNRSLQDVLPTYRWIVDSPGIKLSPSIDFNNAYYGGSSLKISGSSLDSSNPNTITLYKTALPVTADTEISATYKTAQSESCLKLAVSFTDNPSQYIYFNAGSGTANAWNTVNFPLGSYEGKTIAYMGLYLESSVAISNYSINIGELSVRNAPEPQSLPAVSNLTVEQSEFMQGMYANLRLNWDKLNQGAELYEIYKINPDMTRQFIGATPNNAFYAQKILRIGDEAASQIQVIAVDNYFNRGQAASVTITWPDYTGDVNLALYKTAAANQYTNTNEHPTLAVDGLSTTKWCSNASGDKWLAVDLGENHDINRWVVKHAGAGGESADLNTKNFRLQTSADGINWTDVDVVTNNTDNITDRTVSQFNSRYVRLYITTPTQTSDTAARIYEFEIYYDPTLPPPPVKLFTDGFESGNYTTGGWVNNGCDIQTTDTYEGTYANRHNYSDSITKSLSTQGYTDIQVKYARYTKMCETDDHFIAEWYDGVSWHTLEDLAGSSAWAFKTWNLPVEAGNNPNFQLRFRTYHNGSRDYAYVDAVEITGTPQ